MHYTSLIPAFIAAVGASAIPRTSTDEWTITNFKASSENGNPFVYSLQINNGQANCTTSNSVDSTTCENSKQPAAFDQNVCGDDVDTFFSWTLTAMNSVTQPPQPGFSLKISYEPPNQQAYVGCRFIPDNTNCVLLSPYPETQTEEVWNVPESFTLTPTTQTECVYA